MWRRGKRSRRGRRTARWRRGRTLQADQQRKEAHFALVLEKLHGQMRKLEDEIVTLRKKDDDGKPVRKAISFPRGEELMEFRSPSPTVAVSPSPDTTPLSPASLLVEKNDDPNPDERSTNSP